MDENSKFLDHYVLNFNCHQFNWNEEKALEKKSIVVHSDRIIRILMCVNNVINGHLKIPRNGNNTTHTRLERCEN